MKSLTEGFMENNVKVEQTISDDDPDCPFKFEDLKDPEQLKNFEAWYKMKIAKQTGLDPHKIVFHNLVKGSIKI